MRRLIASSLVCFLVMLATAVPAQEPDVVGVYFDAAGTIDRHLTTAAFEAVPLYLVLADPSEPSGISGWEARIDLTSQVVLPPVAWTYANSGINLMTPPDFQVGLGVPLPWAETLVLATGTLLVPTPADEVEIRVGPLDPPSLVVDGYPVPSAAYAAGDDPSRIVPLTPSSGCETTPVAVVNDDGTTVTVDLGVNLTALDLGAIDQGAAGTGDFRVVNSSDIAVGFEATVPSPFLMRTLNSPFSRRIADILRPGQQLTVTVFVSGETPGELAADVVLQHCGDPFATVSLSATVVGPPVCSVAPDTLDFGEVVVGPQHVMDFLVDNDGGRTLELAIDVPCDELSLMTPAVYSVPALGQYTGTLAWQPLVPGELSCAIDLGPAICAPLVCVGTAVAGPPACELAPAALDFGTIDIDLPPPAQTVTIRNTGGQILAGVVPATCGPFQVVSGATSFSLLPTETHSFDVAFQPAETGDFACELDLGENVCAPLTLTGSAIQAPPACSLIPDALDFGEVMLGQSFIRTLRIRNTGGGILTGAVPETCGPFRALSGAGPFELSLQQYLDVRIAFEPTVLGDAACDLVIEGACADVPLHGIGIEAAPLCEVSAAVLDFGSVFVDRYSVRTFVISNLGNFPLTGEVSEQCQDFVVIQGAGPYELGPGEELVVAIRYQPTAVGQSACEIGLGTPHCTAVQCVGRALPAPVGLDLLGLYFDPDASIVCLEPPALAVQTAYLCLVEASDPSGISGWECRLSWDSDAFLPLQWTLAGTGPLNIMTPPSFQVGLGLPTPWEPTILLATVQWIMLDETSVAFYVHPIFQPSLPGVPVYASGVDPGTLIPMVPSSGDESLPVALINDCDVPIGTIGDVPEASLLRGGDGGPGGVRLEWRYDPAAGDGCHLYRRVEGGAEQRLTSLPLSAPDGRVEHLDAAGDVAPGARLTYVFALLRDGEEIARSSEVSLLYQPPAATHLVLHPPRPNPFNPQTSIVFELPRPGRARLSIHDLAGRLVTVLAEGELAAGRHEEIWKGTDAQGRRVPSGVYYCQLVTDQGKALRKLTLLK